MVALTKEAMDAINKMNNVHFRLVAIGEIHKRIEIARKEPCSPVENELLDIVEKLANLVNELALKE